MKLSFGISLALALFSNAADARRLGQDPDLDDDFPAKQISEGEKPLGGVFVNTNQIGDNKVVAYSRNNTGMLNLVGSYSTGGEGFPYKNDILLPDNPVGTQGALTVGGDFVFVVNAGSDSFSQFRINSDMSLSLVSVTPTKSKFPCTIDARIDLNTVCVATCAGEGSIACYEFNDDGSELTEITKAYGGEGAPLKEIHRVESLGIPVGEHPTGNPEDPLNQTRPGINVLVNVKQILFNPAGDALYVCMFNKGIYVYPTEDSEGSNGLMLGEPVLHSIEEGDLSLQHRPFSFAFQETKAGNLLLHVQDPFATLAAELYFPPNVGIGLAAGGTLSTYRVEGTGANSSFVSIMPHIPAGQKGACWVAYNNHTVVTTNTASGTMTVYREQDYLGEGIYDVANADIRGTDADTGMVGFNAGPFASLGGSPVFATPVDVVFGHDGRHIYVLNSVALAVDIYSVDPNENSIQGSQGRVKHIGSVSIPGVAPVTSDPADAGDDEEWKRQIGYWQAWSGAAGIEGMDSYPRPRA